MSYTLGKSIEWIFVSCLLCLQVTVNVSFSRQAQAQSEADFLLAQTFKPSGIPVPARLPFPPPRARLPRSIFRLRRPRTPQTRMSCVVGETSLVALIPNSEFGLPLTVSAHPSFFVYVPRTNASKFEFTLYDDRRELYKLQLQPTAQPGILRLQVPPTVSLQAGKVNGKPKIYQWFLTVVCDESDRAQDLFVGGWVHRSADVHPRGRTAVDFANVGIWYDALAAAYREGTASKLLDEVGLERFQRVPLLN
ncbi:DUF928 domain-containing protein [Oscillatoria salina]|uniref:DUF928 domain-containing protein n=1 Tax=Oscillatoria salina TaxID=331517 RepID=UPI0013B897BA|nr:DUF928 domain-containing protein [Oscillatoria salina]MBZ8179260.1 DUF928 domain-containing protein [Oscillatoria salina IIICB1]NET86771.1 DUF928 domain-containing protein [Kamptonema sp. SIO1D9]